MATVAKRRFIRADGPDKVTGSGRYTADMTLTGMLYARFVYAPTTHARLVRVDTAKARALPGVFAVITHADVPDVLHGPFVPDRRLFAKDVVRFEGDVDDVAVTVRCLHVVRRDVLDGDRTVDSLVVDGHFKSHHATVEAAEEAGMALKNQYQMLQVQVYDAATKTRSMIEWPLPA